MVLSWFINFYIFKDSVYSSGFTTSIKLVVELWFWCTISLILSKSTLKNSFLLLISLFVV